MAIGKHTKKTTRGSAGLTDYHILKKPVITEKTSVVGGDGSCVVFQIARNATKAQIKGAVERIFDVDVKAVNTCNAKGKIKRVNKTVGCKASSRKAYITLQPGQTIDVVEGL